MSSRSSSSANEPKRNSKRGLKNVGRVEESVDVEETTQGRNLRSDRRLTSVQHLAELSMGVDSVESLDESSLDNLQRLAKSIVQQESPRKENADNESSQYEDDDSVDDEDDEDDRSFEETRDNNLPRSIQAQLQKALDDADTNLETNELLFAEDKDAIREIEEEIGSLDFKRKKKGNRKRNKGPVRDQGGYKLTEQQAEVIGKANVAYTMGQFQNAIALIHALIKVAPMAYQAWATLATIYEELGNMDKALQTYLMAAHLSKTDGPLWRRLGALSVKEGLKEQAIYCYGRAIKSNKEDVDALWDRAMLYIKIEHIQSALNDLYSILNVIPNHMLVVKEISRILIENNDIANSIPLFINAITADKLAFFKLQNNILKSKNLYVEQVDSSNNEKEDKDEQEEEDEELYLRMGFEEINILAELYFEMADYSLALNTLNDCIVRSYWWNVLEADPDKIVEVSQFMLKTSTPVDIHSPLPGMPVVANDIEKVSELERLLGKTHFNTILEQLPLELTSKLSICYIKLNDILDNTSFHNLVEIFIGNVYTVEKESLKDYVEIYYDIIDALTEKGYHVSALKILNILNDNESTDDSQTWKRMAICYQHIGQPDTAAVLYEAVVDSISDDNDSKMALAKIYHDFGYEEKAAYWLNEVEKSTGKTNLTGLFFDESNERHLLLRSLAEGKMDYNQDVRTKNRRSLRKHAKKAADYGNDEELEDDEEESEYEPEEDSEDEGEGEGGGNIANQKSKRNAFINTSVSASQHSKEKSFRKAMQEKKKSEENRNFYEKVIELYEKRDNWIDRVNFLRFGYPLISRFANYSHFFPRDRSVLSAERKALIPVRYRKDEGGGYGKLLEPEESEDDPDNESNNESDNEYRLGDKEETGEDDYLLPANDVIKSNIGKSSSYSSLGSITSKKGTNRKPVKTSFQGLSFDEWYDVFIKFAVVAVMSSNEELANNALMTAAVSEIFSKDIRRKISLRLHMLAVATYGGNAARVNDVCRWFCQYAAFTNDTYRLFSAMQTGGSEVVSCYAMASNIKYFQRQMKQMVRNIQSDPDDKNRQSALLFCTYGHLLQAGRSYLQAIGYFMKAYDLIPNDPLVNFSLGLAHLHRSMQRKTENRHLHIMQAYTFIFRYKSLRLGNDETILKQNETSLSFARRCTYEVLYNIGRSFHHLGIYNQAIPYYEKVLKLHDVDERNLKELENPNLKPDSSTTFKKQKIMSYFKTRREFEQADMSREAAYNLSLIYHVVGSPYLAQILLNKYCCI